jgi:hypothetical protein
MTVAIHVTAFRRPSITKLAFTALERTRAELAEYGHDSFVIVGVSEKKSQAIAESFGYDTVWSPNKPLGQKFDAVTKEILNRDFDYYMEFCSDNILDVDYSRLAHEAMTNGIPYWGMAQFYILNWRTKQCRLFTGALSNVGRLTRRYLLENIKLKKNYFYEHRLNRGLDQSFNKIMWECNKIRAEIARIDRPYIVDIKNEMSMNPYGNFAKKEATFPCVPLDGNFPELKITEKEKKDGNNNG